MIDAVCNWAENYIYSIISALMLQKIMELRGLRFSFTVLNLTGTVTFNFFCQNFILGNSSSSSSRLQIFHSFSPSAYFRKVLFMQNFLHERTGGIKIRENASRILSPSVYTCTFWLPIRSPYFCLLCYAYHSNAIRMERDSFAWCLFIITKSLKSLLSEKI